jgi:translocation and assembly module TamB
LRRAALGFTALFGLLLALVAAALLLASTATGFRWLADAAVQLSSGRVIAEGVAGDLWGPIRVRTLVVRADKQRFTLEDLRLQWRPQALLQGRLAIDLVAAQRVRVEILKRTPNPPPLPASLRLPLELRVATWDVARLDVADAGQTYRFSRLHGSLDGSGGRYRARAALATPWADLDGRLELAQDAPFALQGRVVVVRGTPVPVQAQVDLSGRLAAIGFRLDARSAAMQLMAMGEAAPFSRVRLPRLVLTGQGVDPRDFAAAAPRADLAFSGVFEGQPGERLLGSFSLANRAPGRLDQARLPLVALQGAVLGDIAQADFSELAVDLGPAGRFSGDGQWRQGQLVLRLDSPRLDLAGLHRRLYATRLRTALQLTADATRQSLVADVSEPRGRGQLRLSRTGATLRLERATFSGRAGRLAASGGLQLDATRAFSADFDAAGIDPARLGHFPRARLNLRGHASGALRPGLWLQTQFVLPPGELEGRPVKGQGRLRYENAHLVDADVDLDLAGNLAKLKGAYGRPGDRLLWDVRAPALARLYPGLAGQLTSSGSASGEPRQPQIVGQVHATGLKLPGDIAADALALQLSLQAAPAGAFDGALDARGVRLAGQRIDSLHAGLHGRRNGHTLVLDARMPDARVRASLSGSLDADTVWRGTLSQAEVSGKWPMRLTGPATLVLGRERQQVSNLALTLAGGQLRVARFDRQGTRLATQGDLRDLPLAPALGLLAQPPRVTTDLRVNGDWDLRLADSVDGALHLVRQSGDVRLEDPALSLGLAVLNVAMRADAGRVTATLAVDTREAGSLRAEGHATLERSGGIVTLPRGAPLAWTAQLDVPDLRLVRPLLPVGVRLDARVAAQLAGSGSLAAPRIDGRAEATRIRFAMPEEGVAIRDGTLALVLAGDRVQVTQGELKGESGRIVVSGEAALLNPRAGLTLQFEQFAATNRSDRRVIVSGNTRLSLEQKRLQLSGALTADRARVEMPEAGRPTLSSDVVVVGQPPREPPVAQRMPLALDLRLALGNDFLFKGGGLDARLGGQLHVFTVNQVLRAEGTIQVEKGRYAAYAQNLDIERGVLHFVGPIDNPGIDVLAVRKTADVTAGVQVGGTVQRPLVRLYSEPAMPDTEKLSWLVLGHGLDGGGQQEFMLLQVAAGALLSQTESANFQAKLAESLGITSFDVRSGGGQDLGSAVVSVGKRLSSRAMLSYEQSLNGLSQGVKVLYQLSRHLRLEGQAGQQNSFDVFYTRDYD